MPRCLHGDAYGFLRGFFSQDECVRIKSVLGNVLKEALIFVQENCTPRMSTTSINVVANTLRLLSALLPVGEDGQAIPIGAEHLGHLTVFAMLWSVGGLLDVPERAKLHR